MSGTVSRGLSAAVNTEEPGLLKVAVYGPTSIDRNGVLLNLRFTAMGTPGSVSTITVERLMFNEGEPETLVTNGRIELLSVAANRPELTGRIINTMGQGIPNARVTLTDTTGASRTVMSNSFGAYRFGALAVGETCSITVRSKDYSFTPLIVSITDQPLTQDMIAEP